MVCADHPVGDVLSALALDPARGPVAPHVRVQQQGNHHPRVIGRAAMPIGAIVGIEVAHVHPLNRPEDRPHQVVLGHPVAQRRRQQKRLLTTTSDEVERQCPTSSKPRRTQPFSRQPPTNQVATAARLLVHASSTGCGQLLTRLCPATASGGMESKRPCRCGVAAYRTRGEEKRAVPPDTPSRTQPD